MCSDRVQCKKMLMTRLDGRAYALKTGLAKELLYKQFMQIRTHHHRSQQP